MDVPEPAGGEVTPREDKAAAGTEHLRHERCWRGPRGRCVPLRSPDLAGAGRRGREKWSPGPRQHRLKVAAPCATPMASWGESYQSPRTLLQPRGSPAPGATLQRWGTVGCPSVGQRGKRGGGNKVPTCCNGEIHRLGAQGWQEEQNKHLPGNDRGVSAPRFHSVLKAQAHHSPGEGGCSLLSPGIFPALNFCSSGKVASPRAGRASPRAGRATTRQASRVAVSWWGGIRPWDLIPGWGVARVVLPPAIPSCGTPSLVWSERSGGSNWILWTPQRGRGSRRYGSPWVGSISWVGQRWVWGEQVWGDPGCWAVVGGVMPMGCLWDSPEAASDQPPQQICR